MKNAIEEIFVFLFYYALVVLQMHLSSSGQLNYEQSYHFGTNKLDFILLMWDEN